MVAVLRFGVCLGPAVVEQRTMKAVDRVNMPVLISYTHSWLLTSTPEPESSKETTLLVTKSELR